VGQDFDQWQDQDEHFPKELEALRVLRMTLLLVIGVVIAAINEVDGQAGSV